MATRFIAKHGLKSNINRLTLSEGEIAIAYSDDKSEAEIYVGGNDNTPIPAAGASMKTKNQIFVVCDGDHDELKLQAAIDSAQKQQRYLSCRYTMCFDKRKYHTWLWIDEQ